MNPRFPKFQPPMKPTFNPGKPIKGKPFFGGSLAVMNLGIATRRKTKEWLAARKAKRKSHLAFTRELKKKARLKHQHAVQGGKAVHRNDAARYAANLAIVRTAISKLKKEVAAKHVGKFNSTTAIARHIEEKFKTGLSCSQIELLIMNNKINVSMMKSPRGAAQSKAWRRE